MLNHRAAAPDLDQLFHSLADPTRRGMVERLGKKPLSVGELAEPLKMSLPAVMQHLKVLEASGLVRSEKQGRVRTCRLEESALHAVQRWVNGRIQQWNDDLDRLEASLETEPAAPTQKKKPKGVRR